MTVYFIKDRTTGQPWAEERTAIKKQDLKQERDRLNEQHPFCFDKKKLRFVIGEMK